jgi:hypothetical protein
MQVIDTKICEAKFPQQNFIMIFLKKKKAMVLD